MLKNEKGQAVAPKTVTMTKKDFEDKSAIVQQHVMEAISQIKNIQSESDKRISEWQSNVALLTVNAHVNYIKSNFKINKKITKFLDDVKKDILKNVLNL